MIRLTVKATRGALRHYKAVGGLAELKLPNIRLNSTDSNIGADGRHNERIIAARQAQQAPRWRNPALLFGAGLAATGAISYYIGRSAGAASAAEEGNLGSTLPLARVPTFRHNTSQENLEAARRDFIDVIGDENVSTSPSDLDHHASSDWTSHPAKETERSFCILSPGSTQDVSQIMKICHRRKIPVTGYSGGTSLEGHLVPTRGGVCIDFRRMDKVLTLHKDDLDVVVQPAVGWESLNERLAKDNLFFPPDPGPGAMIGGMVGTGCSGTNAYRYGTMREWVLSLTVVLPDGTIIKTRQRPRKSSAGYDLTRLFIGSEGTLGLVTEATLRLTTLPESTSVAVSTFDSLRDAARCVAEVVSSGVPVAAVEILDGPQMHSINEAGTTSRSWREAPTLFFKFAGTAQNVKEQISRVRHISGKARYRTFEFASSTEEQHELWSARKEALWSTLALKRDGDHIWTGDVAVPISLLPDIIEETQRAMSENGLFGTTVGHAGDGNFHIFMLYSAAERKIAERVVGNMVSRAIEMEGTVTGEHGVGLVKRDYLPRELGQSTVDAMRQIKRAFDPLCLLNCDKVIRMQ